MVITSTITPNRPHQYIPVYVTVCLWLLSVKCHYFHKVDAFSTCHLQITSSMSTYISKKFGTTIIVALKAYVDMFSASTDINCRNKCHRFMINVK